MENKFLIGLSVDFGLNEGEVNKVVGVVSGLGLHEGRKFEKACKYICKNGLVETPAEEIVEELKLKGLA